MADDYKIKAKTWLVLAERFTGRVSVLFFTKDANRQAADHHCQGDVHHVRGLVRK